MPIETLAATYGRTIAQLCVVMTTKICKRGRGDTELKVLGDLAKHNVYEPPDFMWDEKGGGKSIKLELFL